MDRKKERTSKGVNQTYLLIQKDIAEMMMR